MYSTDLKVISTDEFTDILKNAYLTKSQRVVLEGLDDVMAVINDKGIEDLDELQYLLKWKAEYPAIANELNVDENYLKVLNRLINAYEVKPMSLSKLLIFDEDEIAELKLKEIVNTRDYYHAALDSDKRNTLSEITDITMDKIIHALHIVDLLRVNGIGLVFAQILYDMGIKTAAQYNNTPSQDILDKFNEINEAEQRTDSKLGLNDIDYCRRFIDKLDDDVDW